MNSLHVPFSPGGSHAIDTTVAERLLALALARGGEYADLFFEYAIGADYVLEEERVKSVGRGVTIGLGVRVLHGDATGYAYSEDLSFDRMAAAATTAGQIAAQGGSREVVAASPIATPSFYPVVQASLAAAAPDKLDLLRRADRAARAFDARIVKVQASFTEEQRDVLIVTSDGRWALDRQPLIRFGASAIAEENGKRQSGGESTGGRKGMELFASHPPEEIGREAARIAIAMLDARDAPAGEMEVVLAAGDSGILLHEAIGHGLEADFNRKQTSTYSGRIGQRVASTLCTVVDDGTIANARGSINVDDEGYAGRANLLIEGGVLRDYMHDRLSARHFRRTPSGNGRRQSFRHVPMPRMTNTLLLAGPHSREEIVGSVKRGVYAVRFSGGQVNISNGDFVFSLTEGYLIEDGKITAPLKGVNLIGNGPDVLTKVAMLGDDFALSDGKWTCGKEGQSVPVGVGTPTVKISAITVGGTKTA